MSILFHGREPDTDVEPFNPSIVARREPSYAHPEAPAVEAHDCPGCDDLTEGRADLCDACHARFVECDAVEYPELTLLDAAWFDVVNDALADLRRARRAA